MPEYEEFITRDGKVKLGYLVRRYLSFEGEWRYIFKCDKENREYRCVRKDNAFVELVL